MFMPLPILIPVPIPIPIPIDNLAEVFRKANETKKQESTTTNNSYGKEKDNSKNQPSAPHKAITTPSNTERQESVSPKRYVLKKHMTSDDPE